MSSLVHELVELREHLAARGIDRVVLCGMGGSSLAPEVIATRQQLPLTILDSTHADQVARALEGPLESTAVVVASKSGTTVETATARAAFEHRFLELGRDPVDHMFFVTDPDSPLHQDATASGYRVFLADPTVGGRFSALTAFGVVPTTLAGADTHQLIEDASRALAAVRVDGADNPAAVLAAALCDPRRPFAALLPDGVSLEGLGDWVEQLVAESTGKDGGGVLPVVLTGPTDPHLGHAPDDVLIVGVTAQAHEIAGADLTLSGHLGEQMVVWQWATAMAGYLLHLNPFDQPDVESAKTAARGLLTERPETAIPLFQEAGISVSGLHLDLEGGGGLDGVWTAVVSRAAPDGYLSLHIYADREAGVDWDALRTQLVSRSKRPVTVGFGPRFLHSTGQFHKGGTPSGVFIQIEVPATRSVPIPGYPFDFAQLIDAQSAGDRQVLSGRGLPVVTLRLDSADCLDALFASVGDGDT
jgi:glucose-6-phosphate isomerase